MSEKSLTPQPPRRATRRQQAGALVASALAVVGVVGIHQDGVNTGYNRGLQARGGGEVYDGWQEAKQRAEFLERAVADVEKAAKNGDPLTFRFNAVVVGRSNRATTTSTTGPKRPLNEPMSTLPDPELRGLPPRDSRTFDFFKGQVLHEEQDERGFSKGMALVGIDKDTGKFVARYVSDVSGDLEQAWGQGGAVDVTLDGSRYTFDGRQLTVGGKPVAGVESRRMDSSNEHLAWAQAIAIARDMAASSEPWDEAAGVVPNPLFKDVAPGQIPGEHPEHSPITVPHDIQSNLQVRP